MDVVRSDHINALTQSQVGERVVPYGIERLVMIPEFDHDVGSLTHGQVSGEIPEGTDAAVWETSESKRHRKSEAAKQRTQDVLEMLMKPESIQQAIILGEVLNRPNFD